MNLSFERLCAGLLIAGGLALSLPGAQPVAARDREQTSSETVPLAAVFSVLTAERNVHVQVGVPYGPHSRQKLDIYEPLTAAKRRAIIVFYYGGAWTSGDRAVYGFVGAAFAARGYTTVIADYRLYPEVRFPTFVEDAARAYGAVARRLGQDCDGPRPIHIMGHSAGAHSAALLALDRSYLDRFAPGAPRPAGFIGLAGPYAFDPTLWPETSAIFAPAAGHANRARPVMLASSHAPPALILHGGSDDVVTIQQSRDLLQALKARGVSARGFEYPRVGHVGLVLSLSKPFRWRADALQRTIAFIDRHAPGRAYGTCGAPK